MIPKDDNIISRTQATNKKYIGVNVRMPETLYLEIDKLSKIEGFSSIPDLIRQAAREYIEKQRSNEHRESKEEAGAD